MGNYNSIESLIISVSIVEKKIRINAINEFCHFFLLHSKQTHRQTDVKANNKKKITLSTVHCVNKEFG